MAHLSQNKNIKTLTVSVFKSQQVQMEFEDSTNFIYGILDYIFQIMDTEDVPEKQIMPSLALLLQGSENDIANIIEKPHNFVRKTRNYLKKSQVTLKITSRFLRGRKRRAAGHVGVFCQNLGITAYTLENYSNFKSKFSFKIGRTKLENLFCTRGVARKLN